jgi:hypothetical protein
MLTEGYLRPGYKINYTTRCFTIFIIQLHFLKLLSDWNNVFPHNGTNLIEVFHSPTDAQLNCLKNNSNIYFEIYTKTAPTCFGAITIIRERTVRCC